MVLHLAYSTSSSGGEWWPWVAFGVFVVVAGTGGPMAVRQWRKIRGPVLQGTAEVLSLRQFGRVGGGAGRQICRLRLGVSVPGREPYSVAIWRNIAPWNLGAFTKGSTIAIEVSERNPRKVQLGRSAPIQGGSIRHVVNLPPKVMFNQSEVPPGELADEIKSVVEGAFQASVGQQAEAYRQMGGAGQVLSAAALLASGQRVPGALKSFAATGTTPRSLGRTPSRPELIDAPHYILEVELHFPNLEPIQARAVQPVPVASVPTLSIGLPVVCAVDPSDPSRRFVIDWDAARA